MIESENIALDDLLSFSQRQEKQGVPIFLVGHSLGGALSIMMAATEPEQFKGVSLIAPLIEYYEPERIQKFIPIARILNKIMPTFKFGIPHPNKPKHSLHFFNDELCQSEKICAHNVMLSDRILKNLHDVYIPKFKSPLLTIECGFDRIVSN